MHKIEENSDEIMSRNPSPQVTKNIISRIPKISAPSNNLAIQLNFEECYRSRVPFSEKISNLRKNLEKLKVDWRDAHCKLELDREKALKQSIEKIKTIDLYKELKINFTGEVSYDAGGIIREWFYILIKELQSEKLSKSK